ncbi:MAG: response regulator [Elusimicrobia bacterium]|nr:response regulator [Elusimicrobiota bacterium]
MPENASVTILVADDDPEIVHLLSEFLERSGFQVLRASDGLEALEKIRAQHPDIAVLDRHMPGLDGFSVCRLLRQDPLFEHMPLVILSAAAERESKIAGLDLGADDFIAKPVDMDELLARVRMILRRTQMGLDANPLTHLPGNASIENRVRQALASGRPLAVLYLDLNQFKAYNDVYGYDAGNRVIRETAHLLIRLKGELETIDFVGHIGGDDFIVLSSPEHMEDVAARIAKEFDALAPGFYTPEDRTRGVIVTADRRGQIREFPIISVAMGVCHNAARTLESFAQISQICTELKRHAKEKGGSVYVIDRRSDPPAAESPAAA